MALLLPEPRPAEKDTFVEGLKGALGHALGSIPTAGLGMLGNFAAGKFDLANKMELAKQDADAKALAAAAARLAEEGGLVDKEMQWQEDLRGLDDSPSARLPSPGERSDLEAVAAARQSAEPLATIAPPANKLQEILGESGAPVPSRAPVPPIGVTQPKAPAVGLAAPGGIPVAPPGMVVTKYATKHSESNPATQAATDSAAPMLADAAKFSLDSGRPAMASIDAANEQVGRMFANMAAPLPMEKANRNDPTFEEALKGAPAPTVRSPATDFRKLLARGRVREDLLKSGGTFANAAQSNRAGQAATLGPVSHLARTGATEADSSSVEFGLARKPGGGGYGGLSFSQLVQIITDGEQAKDMIQRRLSTPGLSGPEAMYLNKQLEDTVANIQGAQDAVRKKSGGKFTYQSYPKSEFVGATSYEETAGEARAPVKPKELAATPVAVLAKADVDRAAVAVKEANDVYAKAIEAQNKMNSTTRKAKMQPAVDAAKREVQAAREAEARAVTEWKKAMGQ